MKKSWLLITIGIVATLIVGIVITKLTVHDLVSTDADRVCINLAIDPPVKTLSFKGLILATGKIQVVKAEQTYGEAKVYTLFRIPLEFFRIKIACDVGLMPAAGSTQDATRD